MAIVATLDVPLRGDTSNIDAALSRTEQRVKGFAGQVGAGIDKAASSIKGGAGKAAAGFGQMGDAMNAVFGRLPGFGLISNALSVFAQKTAAATASMGGLAGQANASVRGASGLAGGSLLAAGAMAGAVGAAIGAALEGIKALVSAITTAIGAMADLGKTAGRLGLTTTALAGLQHGAALAGVSTEDLANHFAKFQRNLSRTAEGTGEAQRAFAQLGLRIEDLKDIDPAAAFGKFADALKDTGNAADKIRLADMILGKGGDSLIPFLSQGSDGIRKMTEEAARLGPVSQQSVGEVRAVTGAWRQFSEAMSGIGRSMAVIFAPVMADIAQGFANVAKQFAGFFGDPANIQFIRVLFNTWTQGLQTWLAIIGEVWSELTGMFGDLGRSLGINLSSWSDWRDGILHVMVGVQVIFDKLRAAFSIAIQSMIIAFKTFVNAFIEGWNYIADDNKATLKIDSNLAKINDAWNRLTMGFGDAMDEKLMAIQNRIDAMSKPDVLQPKGKDIDAISRSPAAMLAGSQEAFKTLFGTEDYQKKAYGVANETLAENREMRRLLQKLVKKNFGIDIGRADL